MHTLSEWRRLHGEGSLLLVGESGGMAASPVRRGHYTEQAGLRALRRQRQVIRCGVERREVSRFSFNSRPLLRRGSAPYTEQDAGALRTDPALPILGGQRRGIRESPVVAQAKLARPPASSLHPSGRLCRAVTERCCSDAARVLRKAQALDPCSAPAVSPQRACPPPRSRSGLGLLSPQPLRLDR